MFTPRVAVLLAVLLTLCVAAPHVRAGTIISPTGGHGLTYSAGSVTMTDGPNFADLLNKSYTPGTGTSIGGSMTERYALQVGGASIEATVARAVTLGEISMAAAMLGTSAYAGWQVGSAIAKAFDIGPNSPGVTDCAVSGGGWKCSERQDGVQGEVWTVHFSHPETGEDKTYSSVTKSGACAQAASGMTGTKFNVGTNEWKFDFGVLSTDPLCTLDGTLTVTPLNGGQASVSHLEPGSGYGQSVSTICPAAIDALNPAWSKPSGSPPGPDGKCPTGRYNAATPEEVAQRLEQRGDPAKIRPIVPDLLDGGQPIPVADGRHITGPSSAPKPGTGGTTTTTNPDGTTTTTTNPPSQNNYTYSGDTITYNTTVTNNNTTTTTSETNDPCEKDPERVGCLKLGDPGDGKPVWQTKEVPFSVEDLGFSGACPAPLQFDFYHGTMVPFDFQPICDIAPIFRAFLLALVAVSCSWMIIKQTTQA